MEIIKNRLCHFGQLQTGTDLLEESQSIIVPDTCPDVLQIIGTNGWLNIQEKNCNQGKLRITGQVNCTVCYLPVEGKEPRTVSAAVPFHFAEEIENMEDDDRLLSLIRLLGVSTVMLNPRKLMVKVQLQLVRKLYKWENVTYAEEIRQGESEGVHTLQEQSCMQYIADIVEKRLVLSDEIRLSNDQPNEQSIFLQKNCTWVSEDVKLLPGKIMLRGRIDAEIACMDPSGEFIGKNTFSVPFSQIVESDSVGAEDQVVVSFSPVREEIEFSTAADGVTTMHFSFAAVSECLIQKQCSLIILQDAFSTKWETKTQQSRLASPAEGEIRQVSVPVCETILLENSAAQILRVSVVPETAVIQQGEYTFGSMFHAVLIYKEEDGTIMTTSKRFYAEGISPLALQTSALCLPIIHDPSAAVTGEGEVQLTFEAVMCCTEGLGSVHTAIETCTIEPIARKGMEKQPSLIVRTVQKEESVWSMAKAYGTSPDSLAAANKLEKSSLFPAGRLVMIPFVSH